MKAVVVHFVLAVLGLGSAYQVWSEPEGAEEGDDASSVVVVDCEPSQLSSLTLTTETGKFTIEKKKGKEGDFWWGTTSSGKSSRGEGSSAESSADTTPAKNKAFAISSKVDEYFKVAAPMRAVRNLGEVDQELAKEIELADTKTSFELKCGSKSHVFDVGIAASGSGDRYLRKKGGGPVYLVRRDLIEKIERADSQLMQRQLTDHEARDVEHLVVKALGAEAKLLHHNRLDPKTAEWVDSAKPEQRNELYGNWLNRVGRLSVSDYLEPEQKPGEEQGAVQGTLKPVATLEYLDEDGEVLDKVELARIGEEQGEYYGRSSSTRAWVRVLNSVARQVESDLPMIVGLEEIPEAPPEPKADELPAGHPPI